MLYQRLLKNKTVLKYSQARFEAGGSFELEAILVYKSVPARATWEILFWKTKQTKKEIQIHS